MSLLEFKEKDLHPYLVYFAHYHFGCYSKTIDEGKSHNKQAGENEWIHPDIVSFKLMRNDFVPQVQSFYRHMNQDTAYLYSFELKREIKLSDLKKYYFQAVSNSSWANEGYLVTAILDTSNRGLMEELERLVQAFGIGVILLNIEVIEQSKILFEAKKRTELDFFTINKLIKQGNSDFIEFIEVVSSCLEAKNQTTELAIIQQRMDKIDAVHCSDSKKTEISVEKRLVDPNLIEESRWYLAKGRDFKFTNIKTLKIKDRVIPVKNWRIALLEMAKYCKEINPILFQTHCVKMEEDSVELFFRDSRRYWHTERTNFRQISDNVFIYTHGDCNQICLLIEKMAQVFGIPFDAIAIQIEDRKNRQI